jgi:glycosyltransferase involved in cell wall biosynthesis
MRVLYFSRDYTTHDHRFLKKLVGSRHSVWYLRLQYDGIPYEKRPVPEGIHEIAWPGGDRPRKTVEEWLGLMPHFETVLEQIRPDLIHAGPVQSCGFMTALSGFQPFVLMSWGSDMLVDSDRSELWRWVTEYTLKRSSLFLCDCGEVTDKAHQLVEYPKDRVVQFPWGIDLEMFQPGPDALQFRNRPGWEDAFIVLCTRSWEETYRIDLVLEAFERAHAVNSRLRLVLVGGGSLAPMVHRYIEERRLHGLVLTPGMVPQLELAAYYRAVDLYLSCSGTDGTSVSLLEAMACGLPVVVTDRRSNAEWVSQGRNGWLAESGNADSFAQALLHAAAMAPDEMCKVSAANRRLAGLRADWARNSDLLLDAYERIRAAAEPQLTGALPGGSE